MSPSSSARRHLSALRLWSGLLVLGCLLMVSGVAFAQDGAIAVKLTPRLADDSVERVDVDITLTNPDIDTGEVLLALPLVRAMAPSALTDSASMVAEDAAGPLPLTIDEDAPDPTNFNQGRRWRAGRATSGDVHVRYAAIPRVITPETRAGPLYDMRREGTGVYGAAATILALPPEGRPRPVRLSWDLSHMAPGARGVSSLGEGDVDLVAPYEALANAFLMAGPVISQPKDGQGDFIGYWMTPPVYDLPGVLAELEPAYQAFAAFFDEAPTPFRVFMRTTPTFAGGGSGGYHSFIFGQVVGEPRDKAELLALLTHETLHNWLNGLGEETSQWWSEGSTSYYTPVLAYRAGLTDLDQFAAAMNDLARLYYENPRSQLPNDEVTRLFFSDGDAQVVPYQRGPLYFAQLNARIRRASDGRRGVDDLVKALLAARRTGGPYSKGAWVDLVRGELGDAGVEDFEAMMAGRPLDLPSDLLGACFTREATVTRRFEPGMRVDAAGRVLRVTGGSFAETAGVAVGDVLSDPEGWAEMGKREPGQVSLSVLRDGRPVDLTFTPWGPERAGYRWVRTGVPETACGI